MIVRMDLSDLIQMDYVDYEHMNVICNDCDKAYRQYSHLDTGEYIAEHGRGPCFSYLTFTTEDILDWKAEDDQFDDIVESLKRESSLPIVGLSYGEIVDGGHRLAAARHLGMTRVLVEDDATSSSQDSGKWYPWKPIITIPGRRFDG